MSDPDLDSDITAGLTPRGTRLLTGSELVRLLPVARVRRILVSSIEAYFLRGGDEVLALEYSLIGPDERYKDRPWIDRVAQATAEARALVDKAASASDPVIFQVWLAAG